MSRGTYRFGRRTPNAALPVGALRRAVGPPRAREPRREDGRLSRAALRGRLRDLSEELAPDESERLGDRLALIVDGTYTSAAHLGAGGPAAAGADLAAALVETARRNG
jgi:hypothetical protein